MFGNLQGVSPSCSAIRDQVRSVSDLLPTCGTRRTVIFADLDEGTNSYLICAVFLCRNAEWRMPAVAIRVFCRSAFLVTEKKEVDFLSLTGVCLSGY